MTFELTYDSDGTVVTAHSHSTICELICVQLQRIYEDQDHAPHEDEIVRLANILFSATKTYGAYVVAIHYALEALDYAGALRAGKTMLAHETMLHSVGSGQTQVFEGAPH
ncbi:hypothetical protein FV219_02470 [Methylobacterium sp. WL122]|nr:hypothetical protein FV219_02470 [Methylobacterium sp. WL122]